MTIFATGFLTYLALIVAIGAQTLFLLRQIVRRDRVWTVLIVCFVGDVALLALGAAGIGVVAERWPWLVTALTVAGVVYLVWFAAGALRSAVRGQRTLAAAAEAEGPAVGLTDGEIAALTGELPLIDPATGRLSADFTGRTAEGRAVPVGAVVGTGHGHDPLGDESRTVGGIPVGNPRLCGTRPGERGADGRSGGVAVKQRVQPRRVVLSAPQTPLARIVLLALSVSFLNPHAILDTVVMMGTFAQTYGPGKWVYVGGAVAASLVWFTVLGWGGTRLAPYMNTPRTWRIVDAAVGVLMLVIAAKVGLTLL